MSMAVATETGALAGASDEWWRQDFLRHGAQHRLWRATAMLVWARCVSGSASLGCGDEVMRRVGAALQPPLTVVTFFRARCRAGLLLLLLLLPRCQSDTLRTNRGMGANPTVHWKKPAASTRVSVHG